MRAVLKIADHRGEGVVVRRIQIINDRLRQQVVGIQLVQIRRERLRLRKIADGIEARVRSELLEQAVVVIAQRAEVKLLRPAALGVEMAEEHHHERGELRMFQRRNRLALARLVKNSGGGFLGTKIRETVVHAVVGQAAALRMEKIMALFQRATERAETVDVNVRGGGKLLDPLVESRGLDSPSAPCPGRNAGSIFVGWPDFANTR